MFRSFILRTSLLLALLVAPAGAQFPIGSGIVSGGGGGVLSADGTAASVDLNFRTNSGFNQGTSGTAASMITTTRTTTNNAAYAADYAGNYSLFTDNTARITAQGLLIEETRTNGIRNNSNQGAAVADGIELLTNPNFTGCTGSTCTGWTVNLNGGTGSVTFSGGTTTITGDGAHVTLLTQQITTVSGRVYFIAVKVGTNPVTIQAGTTSGGVDLLAATPTATANGTTYTLSFTATGTTSWIGFSIPASSSTTTAINTTSTQWAGALPTNWFFAGGGLNLAQMSYQIVGLGSESGIDDIDVRTFGTVNCAGCNLSVALDAFTGIPANYGQTWATSIFARIQSVTGTFGSYFIGAGERNGTGGGVTSGAVFPSSFTPSTTGALGTNRVASTQTVTNPLTAFVVPLLSFQPTVANVFYDQTIRLGWQQLENNALINASVSNTTLPTITAGGTGWGTSITGGSLTWLTANAIFVGQALAPSNTGSGCTTGLQTFSTTTGTGTAATMTATVAGGVVPAGTLTIVNPGNFTVSPGTTGVVLSGGGCTTGPTVNLTVGSCPTAPVLTANSNASGVISAITAVPTQGSCTVMLPSNATVGWNAGGGLTQGSALQLGLTPTVNATQALFTSPIRTAGAVATRNADAIILTSVPAFSTSGLSYYVQGTPLPPIANLLLQIQLGLWNSSTTFGDYIRAWRGSGGGFIGAMTSGGVGQGVAGGTTGTASEYAYAIVLATNRQANALNGTATTAANTDTLPTGINTVKVGNENSNNLFYNGYMERFAIWPTFPISNAGVANLTATFH